MFNQFLIRLDMQRVTEGRNLDEMVRKTILGSLVVLKLNHSVELGAFFANHHVTGDKKRIAEVFIIFIIVVFQ